LITWTLSRDMLHGFTTSFFRNEDKFLPEDIRPAVVLFSNLYSVGVYLYFVAVYKYY
jgi:hypothetical protein